MKCHVCKNDIVQFVPIQGEPSPIPKLFVGFGKYDWIFFCAADEEQMPSFQRAVKLIVRIGSGEIKPVPGLSVQETIYTVLRLGVRQDN